MGALIGGLVSGVGSYLASRQQAKAQEQAAQTALTGYNYLRGSAENNQYITNGAAANNSQAQLLGQAPITDATKNGFTNYLGSTGYNFNLKSGSDAIASQGAASGLLNSGGTGKALIDYGQNVGQQYFNNYLSQLGGLSNQGQASLFAPATSANAGGASAAAAIGNAGDARAQGTSGLFNHASEVIADPSVSGNWSWSRPGMSARTY